MRRQPGRDLIAGVTVAVVALPLALAFGISSGMGASAGLVTAIIAGAAAAVFGGSNLQVSGPTGAMAVVLLPVVAMFGAAGVLVVGVMAGVLLIALAFARAGQIIRFLPLPVVEGFTIGIAIIIGLQQIPAALGVTAKGEKVAVTAMHAITDWASAPGWSAPAITLAVAACMLTAARYRPALPASLLAIAAVTALTARLDWTVATIGSIPRGLPIPQLPGVDRATLSALLLPAVAVAALAALESLLSATVADGMSVGHRHDPDRELFGQGIANLLSPLFGGIPATGAIARTAVNVRSGARSRLAALTHAFVILLVVLVAATLVAKIPLAALAGVLLATVIQMVEVSNVRALLRATRGDAAVLLLTAAATIAFDLVTAVLLGLLLAGFHALLQVARSAHVDEIELDTSDHSEDERRLLAEHVVAYRLDGPLFFGAAHTFLLELAEVSNVKVVILRMSRIQTLDATGATVLGQTIRSLEARGITVLLSGTKPQHRQIFEQLGVLNELAHDRHVFDTTPDAIIHAHRHVAREEH